MFRFILGVVTGLLSSILFIFGGFFSFIILKEDLDTKKNYRPSYRSYFKS